MDASIYSASKETFGTPFDVSALARFWRSLLGESNRNFVPLVDLMRQTARDATKKFQKDRGLTVTGLIDAKTLKFGADPAKIEELLKKQ